MKIGALCVRLCERNTCANEVETQTSSNQGKEANIHQENDTTIRHFEWESEDQQCHLG